MLDRVTTTTSIPSRPPTALYHPRAASTNNSGVGQIPNHPQYPVYSLRPGTATNTTTSTGTGTSIVPRFPPPPPPSTHYTRLASPSGQASLEGRGVGAPVVPTATTTSTSVSKAVGDRFVASDSHPKITDRKLLVVGVAEVQSMLNCALHLYSGGIVELYGMGVGVPRRQLPHRLQFSRLICGNAGVLVQIVETPTFEHKWLLRIGSESHCATDATVLVEHWFGEDSPTPKEGGMLATRHINTVGAVTDRRWLCIRHTTLPLQRSTS
jgi:hypothetical protein